MTSKHTPGSYDGYSTARLAEQHAYWMSVERAAKNSAQRARADRNLCAIGTELRARAALAKAGQS